MTTYTQNLVINLIATGEETNTWGEVTNNNFQYGFEQAIVGRATVTFADADVTITTSTDVASNQTFRDLYLYCTGTNTAIRTLNLPAGIYKNYIIDNSISGSFNLNVKTTGGAGSSIAVPYGKRVVVYLNGVDVLQQETYMPSGLSLGVPLAITDGGTGGNTAALARSNLGLSSGATTTVGTMATQNASNVAITGGTITGITALGTPAGGTGLSSYATGDTLYFSGGQALSRLTAGVSKSIMTSTGTAPQWVSSLDVTQGGTGLSSYSAGDINYYASGFSMTKLGIGTVNSVLTSSGTAPQWTSTLTTAQGGTGVSSYSAGDITYYSTGTALSKINIGASGTALVSSGTAPAWVTQYSTVTFIMDGGGTALTAGVKGTLTIPFACTISEWTLLGDQAGAISITIGKSTYANYPGTITTISGSAPPTISSGNTKGQSSTLTGWTSAISAGDVLQFTIASISTLTRVTLSLKVYRT